MTSLKIRRFTSQWGPEKGKRGDVAVAFPTIIIGIRIMRGHVDSRDVTTQNSSTADTCERYQRLRPALSAAAAIIRARSPDAEIPIRDGLLPSWQECV